MLELKEIRACLSPNLDQKRKTRFEVAFRSLKYQEEYCRYHFEQYHENQRLFIEASRSKLEQARITNPQYYRISFEAHCFAFFRAFHALIESVPYLLNLVVEAENDSEFHKLSWNRIINFCEANGKYQNGVLKIKELRKSVSYKELQHISNVTKHRRIPRVDSGLFSQSFHARFCKDDLDIPFRSYEIDTLMQDLFDEIHPKVLKIIKGFISQ